MAVVPESSETLRWLVKAGVVRSCIQQLLSQRIHPLFSAYLCLERVSFREGRADKLRPDWNECFGTFFMVQGNPDGRPYFRPFVNQRGKVDQAWLNPNLAGSFAATSIRPGTAFTRVVEINAGTPTTYSLLDRHWELARLHLTDNKQVPVLPLAAFLYRNFGLNSATVPLAADLVRVFKTEFGYQPGSSDPNGEQFDHLFVDNSGSVDVADWFELVGEA